MNKENINPAYNDFLRNIQKEKMKEIWGNKEDISWEVAYSNHLQNGQKTAF